MSDTIRPATLDDRAAIKALAVATGLYDESDVEFFDDMIAGAVDGSMADHHWLVVEHEGGIVASAYYAPEPFADRVWNLYFLAVSPGQQSRGSGAAIVAHVEGELRQRGEGSARVLIVETSSTDGYERTRSFYRSHGFVEEARIREFYGPGDHKVVFWRSLVS